MTTPLLQARDVSKTYRLGRVDVPVLRGASIEVGRGEWVAVLGSSGSGKSTLLHILGGLDRPDRGRRLDPRERAAEIAFEGRSLTSASKRELDRYRRSSVGFVFQFYHLMPELTVLENVVISAMIRRGLGYATRAREARARAKELLDSVGLAHRLRHRPRELSGGERQRVALARALINDPAVLLADEPTGNLDRATGEQVLGQLAEIRRSRGLTMVMVTHDRNVAERADRTVRLVDGRVAADASM
ncbi:MAG: ABC transporter ATP-binding protein [Phycisphaerales bacterium]|nr:ABC transporter ATP-binding protein [Phycisphaerales bacterium]